jgi:glycosyltransferase involved in cell wall biosynthesis
MQAISAVIITFNESRHIERAIRSVQNLADEILVIDSGSTDDTPSKAAALGATVIQQPWLGFGPQKNVGQSIAQHDYILSLDADEALSDTLRMAIQEVKEKGLQGAYAFNRLNFYYGKFLRHGKEYPDWKIRLYNRKEVRWNEALVHEELVGVDMKKITQLNGDFLHYTYATMADHLQKMNRYTSLAAEDAFKKGKKVSWLKILGSPIAYFFSAYFLKGGFKDGAHGFILARMGAFGTFLKYSKLHNLHYQSKQSSSAS